MKQRIIDRYKKEFQEYPFRHQTINIKETFLCLAGIEKEEIKIFDTPLSENFVYCPFCGEKLGKAREIKDGRKIIWEDKK
jgi:hypothetical protein